MLRANKHRNSHLQSAWNRHGEDNFEFSVLAVCSPGWCLCVEQIHILGFKAIDPEHGYNRTPNAGSTLGRKMSESQRLNLSRLKTGKKMSLHQYTAMVERARSDENRKRASERAKSRWNDPIEGLKLRAATQSPETRAKQAAIIATKEYREKLSRAQKARWTPEMRAELSKNTHFLKLTPEQKLLGKIKSKQALSRSEVKQKMSEEAKRRWGDPDYRKRSLASKEKVFSDPDTWARILEAKRTPEARANMSAAQKSRWTEEARRAWGESRIGMKHSNNTKQKMSLSAKARWAKKPHGVS